jgi:hypothetical protein
MNDEDMDEYDRQSYGLRGEGHVPPVGEPDLEPDDEDGRGLTGDEITVADIEELNRLRLLEGEGHYGDRPGITYLGGGQGHSARFN